MLTSASAWAGIAETGYGSQIDERHGNECGRVERKGRDYQHILRTGSKMDSKCWTWDYRSQNVRKKDVKM